MVLVIRRARGGLRAMVSSPACGTVVALGPAIYERFHVAWWEGVTRGGKGVRGIARKAR